MPRSLSPEEVADFRDRLCAAAERLFAQRGLEGVSMRQLADELGVSAMTPYGYFRDKNEMLAAVRASGFNKFAEALEVARSANHDPTRARTVAGEAYLEFAFENPHAYKLMFDLNQPDEVAYPGLVAAMARSRATMSAYVQDQIDAGLLKGTAEQLGEIFWASIHGAIVLEMAGGLPPGRARELTQELSDALGRGLAPAT